MIAAVLDLHIGTRARAEAFDQVRGGLLDRHDVVDHDPLAALDAEAGEGPGFELLLIADDVIDFLHRREARRIDLRRAAGDDDLGLGAFAARPPDRLPGLAHRLAGHRASIDDHRAGKPGGARMLAHDFGLIGVEPAAEGDDLKVGHWRLLT
jgi:hypothetical protein